MPTMTFNFQKKTVEIWLTRQIAVLSLVWLIFAPSVSLHAQDTVLYMEIAANHPDARIDWEFLETLEDSLRQENIRLIIIDDIYKYPYFWEQSAMVLTFTPLQSRQMIFITPYITMKLSPSPLLEASMWPVAAIIDTEDNETLSEAITLSTGMAFYATQNCDRARRELGTALFDNFIHPYSTKAIIFYIANCVIVENDLATAQRLLKSIIPKARDRQILYAEAMINLAWIDLQTERQPEASELMDELVEIIMSNHDIPYLKDVRVLSKSAQFHSFLSEFDSAFNDLNIALDIAAKSYTPTTSAELYTLRGQMYLNIYEWDKSLEDYNTALNLDPDYADAWFQRGVLYYSILQTGQELREDALTDFQHYLDLAPEGQHADEARRYVETIEAEMAALNE